ncbi:MAG: PQQ-binding-like beta-propeller repeat protein, partial [Candidatus Bathyarchaeia archaeon]
MRKHKYFLILITLTISAVFCSISINFPVQATFFDDWPMFRHDPAHTGHSESSAPTENITVLWTAEKGLVGSPVVANGFVYMHSSSELRCLNASDGQEIWNVTSAYVGGQDYSPAVYEGYIYTPGAAYNAFTGTLFLNYTYCKAYGSPTVTNDIIYMGSPITNCFFALNAITGQTIWNFTTGGEIESSAAVSNGYIYFVSFDDNIYALDAFNGTKIWNFKVNSSLAISSPAVFDGCVYVGSHDNVYCLNAINGTKLWNNSKTGCTSYCSPAVANGVVYIGSMDNNLYA